jgi:hypothetical protein
LAFIAYLTGDTGCFLADCTEIYNINFLPNAGGGKQGGAKWTDEQTGITKLCLFV